MIFPCDVYANSMAKTQFADVKTNGKFARDFETPIFEHFQSVVMSSVTNAIVRTNAKVFVIYNTKLRNYIPSYHIREYTDWLSYHADQCSGYCAPYINDDCKTTTDILYTLYEKGLSPIPAIGERDSHEYIDLVLSNANTVMVWPSANAAGWLASVQSRALQMGRNIHWMGYTNNLLADSAVGYDTLISSMWALATKRGKLIVGRGLVEVVNEGSRDHISYRPEFAKEVRTYVEARGFDLDQVSTNEMIRAYYNLQVQSEIFTETDKASVSETLF